MVSDIRESPCRHPGLCECQCSYSRQPNSACECALIIEVDGTASQSGSQFPEWGSEAVFAGTGVDSTVLTGAHGGLKKD